MVVQKIEKKLNDCSLYPVIMQTMPQTIWIYSVVDALKETFALTQDEQKEMTHADNIIFDGHIKKILKNVSSVQSDYNLLYKKIIVEQNRILKNFSSKERLEAIKKYKAAILDRMGLENRLPELLHDVPDVKTVESGIPLTMQQKKKIAVAHRKTSKYRRGHIEKNT